MHIMYLQSSVAYYIDKSACMYSRLRNKFQQPRKAWAVILDNEKEEDNSSCKCYRRISICKQLAAAAAASAQY
jgi:hypothetical protein